MTSSLVGSEMCIRDSMPPERHGNVSIDCIHRWMHLISSTDEDRRACRNACLLYTSDAADDM
eukprot:1217594-Prorocentrum_lima.AAC.1